MKKQNIKVQDCYMDVDRMINEGLGGGLIHYEYDKKKFEPQPVKTIKMEESGDKR